MVLLSQCLRLFFINCYNILRNMINFKLGWWNLLLPGTACRLVLPLEVCIPLTDVIFTSLQSYVSKLNLFCGSYLSYLWSMLLRNFLFTTFWLNIDLLFSEMIHCSSFISTWWLTPFWHFSIGNNLSVMYSSPVLWITKVLLHAHNLLWLYWYLSFKLGSNEEVEYGMTENDW